MRTLALLLAATALSASPAVAQHTGHSMPGMNMPGMTMPMPEKKPAAKKPPAKKKPAAKKPVANKAVAKKAPAKKAVAKRPASAKPTAASAGHAGHDMSTMPGMEMPDQDMSSMPGMEMPDHDMPATPSGEQPNPHAGHQMPAGQPSEAQPADAHAGHDMSTMPGMEMPEQDMSAMPGMEGHAGHDMNQMEEPAPPTGPPPPEALTGPEWAADAYWPGQPQSRATLTGEHGTAQVGRFLIDRAETRARNGRDGYLVDIQAWYGGDLNKLWLKSEVEGDWGKKLEHAEVQALWSHAIGPFFDFQAGVRYDPQPGPNRSHLVLGVEGLAPYWWEVEGAVFLSNKGDVTARAEGEYDLRITQKLILQPRGEVNLSAQDIRELGIGAGLSTAELGLRLRYQFSPLFAPYVGVEYQRAFGNTRDFRRVEGEDPDGWNLLAGIRLWF